MWIYKHELITLLGASDHASPGRYVTRWCKQNGVPVHRAKGGAWRVARGDFDAAFAPPASPETVETPAARAAFAVWSKAG